MQRSTFSAVVILAALTWSCSDNVTAPLPAMSGDCADLRARSQPTSSGVPQSGGVWTLARSPYLISTTLNVKDLTIEPGVVVCVAPGARVSVETLDAVGTADAPIHFMAAGDEYWGGIEVGRRAFVQHAIVRNAEAPLRGSDDAARPSSITVEDARIVGSTRTVSAAALVLRRVDIDSACSITSCAAVAVRYYGSAVLEDVRIRHSGGAGVSTGDRCSLAMRNVLIEGSRGVGLSVPSTLREPCSVNVEGEFRITAGASYPLRGTGHLMRWLHPDRIAEVTGNAADTIVIDGPLQYSDSLRIPPQLSLRITDCFMRPYNAFLQWHGRIIVDAGATLSLGAEGACLWRMRLQMRGTEAQPATLRAAGLVIRIDASDDTSRIVHADLENVFIQADSGAAVLENVRMQNSSIELMVPGSRIDGLTANGSAHFPHFLATWFDGVAAVALRAGTHMRRGRLEGARYDGVRVLGDATIQDCTITGSGRDGIRVDSGAVSIRRCNLVGNAGVGANGLAATPTDAVENWWGDAAGPSGPAGDGAAGSVSYTPWLTMPVTWDPAVAGATSISPRFRR